MLRFEIKNYNTILIEKQQKDLHHHYHHHRYHHHHHNHQKKLVNMNNLHMSKYKKMQIKNK